MHRHGVGEGIVGLDVGIFGGHAVEDATEEGVAAQDVGLVAAGDAALPIHRRAVPLARQFEGRAADALDTRARHHHRIRCDLVTKQNAAAARGVKAFGVLADDHVIDLSGPAARSREGTPS